MRSHFKIGSLTNNYVWNPEEVYFLVTRVISGKIAQPREAKKNLKNCVRLLDTVPRIFCSLLPKLFSFNLLFAPWSFWSHAPCTFNPLQSFVVCIQLPRHWVKGMAKA